MKKDAEMHNDDDQKKREEVEVKNAAEQLTYTAEKSLKDAGDKVPADLKKSIEDKIAAVKTAKNGSDIAAIKSTSEALSSELSKIGEILSKAQAEQAKQQSEPNPDKNQDGKGNDGNVRDAEFKEGDKK